MNVTVVVAKPLQAACEGRSRIELGVPNAADIGDILHTLMSLYPGLRAFEPSERKHKRPAFTVAAAGRTIFLLPLTTQRA